MPAKRASVSDSLTSLVEQLVNRVLRPLGLIVISPDRIRETLEQAAERGRVTRSDANDLALELIRRGREQTEELLVDLDTLLGRGREQLGSATRRVRRKA